MRPVWQRWAFVDRIASVSAFITEPVVSPFARRRPRASVLAVIGEAGKFALTVCLRLLYSRDAQQVGGGDWFFVDGHGWYRGYLVLINAVSDSLDNSHAS